MSRSLLILIITLSIGGSGCSLFSKRVKAYERQYLSQTGMEFISHPMDAAAEQHMLNAREGSSGGFGGAGGGCGCN